MRPETSPAATSRSPKRTSVKIRARPEGATASRVEEGPAVPTTTALAALEALPTGTRKSDAAGLTAVMRSAAAAATQSPRTMFALRIFSSSGARCLPTPCADPGP